MAVFVYFLKTMLAFTALFLLYRATVGNTTLLTLRRRCLFAMLPLSFLLPWASALLPKYYLLEPESFLAWADATLRRFAFAGQIGASAELLDRTIYIALGAGFFAAAVKLALSLLSTRRFLKDSRLVTKNEHYTLRTGNNGKECFCFLKTIYLSNPLLNEQNLDIILEHEKAHVRQKHYLDVCFSALCGLLLWFFPLVKRFRSAWEEVLECMADRQVISALQIEPIAYQSALCASMGYSMECSNIPNPFNQAFGRSMLAKRLLFISRKPTEKKRLLPRAVLSLIAMATITAALAFMDAQIFKLQKIGEIRNAGYELHEVTAGYVFDCMTDMPVANAIIKGEGAIAVTDSDGFFFMKASPSREITALTEPDKDIFADDSAKYYLCSR